MAKHSERSVARVWYVEQGKTAKEISQKLNVSEKTIGEWVKRYGWKEQRNARENSIDKRIENIKSVIDDITSDRSSARLRLQELETEYQEATKLKDHDQMELIRQMRAELKKEIIGYDDAISKWNKALENLDKENKVSLSNYLYVMDDVFKALQAFDQKLYMKTLDFQDQHINNISLKLG